MKKTMCFLAASTVLISGLCQAAGVMNETVLKEKAAFSLGVTKDKVTIEKSDRTPEENNYYFNARYQGKLFQCYVAHIQNKMMSDAVCHPTDGSDLPR